LLWLKSANCLSTNGGVSIVFGNRPEQRLIAENLNSCLANGAARVRTDVVVYKEALGGNLTHVERGVAVENGLQRASVRDACNRGGPNSRVRVLPLGAKEINQ